LAETKDFKVAVDEDDATLVTFTLKTGKIVDGYEYKTNVALVLADKHGVAAVNVDKDETVLYGEYRDEENPYIVNVTAKDRYTVEVEYNEAIGTAGIFEIKNTDETATYKTISISKYEIKDNKVVLTLNLPLESRYDYQLTVKSQAKDLVGNAGEDKAGDEFFFTGTDLAPIK
ncbi:MAG: Ig-like domain-containing protein, partial [Lutispora sp.]